MATETDARPAAELVEMYMGDVVAWLRNHRARLIADLAAARTNAERAAVKDLLGGLELQVRRIEAAARAGAWWHVTTQDGEHRVVAYQGNGGHGPVHVLVPGRGYLPVATRRPVTAAEIS